ncbi:MAG TPA: 2-succinyl-5-enolpyruvyl-6-hydroxy-3-cyclohexene-1-carboxylic-acid synthase, partial [Acidimicrobiales bacterium]|nr:2-succinyl-5-enolpyruvyl-6-hydroxy-3-cyclohexene-1-carboxylic-acid synthase [Acidimicrobiales bacterium]
MSAALPEDVQAAFCAVLCDEWARAGVTHAVVSPGSRSTPLVAALDAEARIRVAVVLDERSAGFTAVGLGRATGRPAVVVTTSGTAAVELHPAVVEAGQDWVPLIAVTADRPPELHHVGAPQTVEQPGLFGPVVRWAADPGVPDAAGAAAWRSLAARSVAEAVAGPEGPGPVHLNLPFREPLLGDAGAIEWPPGRPGAAPWHSVAAPGPAPAPPEVVDVVCRFAGGRGLIVAGAGSGSHGGVAAVLALSEHLGWPVLAEPRSGCRVPMPDVVSAADSLLRTPSFQAFRPEVVLRLGPPWASKVLNQWLAALAPSVPQIVVDRWGRWADPDRTATHLARTSPAALLAALPGDGQEPGPVTEWLTGWRRGDQAARTVLDRLLGPGGELACSEPAVAQAAVRALPPGGTLVVSSSMPVRDVEWYGPPAAGVRVVANRGANGIDGVLSTALGVAMADPEASTIALLGDLAFLYDAGALLWAASRPARLKVVVVDNQGGGIFSFLPQAAGPPERFERYWGTPHDVDLV